MREGLPMRAGPPSVTWLGRAGRRGNRGFPAPTPRAPSSPARHAATGPGYGILSTLSAEEVLVGGSENGTPGSKADFLKPSPSLTIIPFHPVFHEM